MAEQDNNKIKMQLENKESSNESELKSMLSDRERDLRMAAEFGRDLLEDNSELRARNKKLLEDFQQKIYEMEREKQSLKMRLVAAEHDYDTQMRELRVDIVQLHQDIKKQKLIAKESEEANSALVNDLASKNKNLEQQLDDSKAEKASMNRTMKHMQQELEEKRIQMHAHLQQLEVLRKEVTQLTEEKKDLEQRLNMMQEERDILLKTLTDSRERVHIMEEQSQRQNEYIQYQDNQIQQLEFSAAALQKRLEEITLNERSSRPSATSVSKPTHSLYTELQNSDVVPNGTSEINNLNNDSAMMNDEEFEMDDDAFIAYVQSLGTACFSDVNSNIPEASTSINNNHESFMEELRAEVVDVYQQMTQMCAEMSHCTGGDTGGRAGSTATAPSRTGYDTPDELAFVEMGFRLQSLRGVLTDLRGLLSDIVIKDPTLAKALKKLPSSKSLMDLESIYIQQHEEAELKVKELQKLNAELETTVSDANTDGGVANPVDPSSTLEMINMVQRERDIMRERRNELQNDLRIYQSDMDNIRAQIQHIAQIEGSTLPELPSMDLIQTTFQNFEDDEKYEFEM